MAYAQKFEWAELDLKAECGSDGKIIEGVLKYLADTTSIDTEGVKKALKISDAEIFEHPFLLLSCKSAPGSLDYSEIQTLRMYLISGGTIFINDRIGAKYTDFDSWVRRTLKLIMPDSELAFVRKEHPLLRSFFMINGPAGRFAWQSVPETVEYGGRAAVIYVKNDLLGMWLKDSFGNYLHPCIPGGEEQRAMGRKLFINIIMYSMTGSYKSDAVHQPYILEKLRIIDAGGSNKR